MMNASTDSHLLPITYREQLGMPKPAYVPKVLTASLLAKLAMVNNAVRWLRKHGYAPIQIDTTGYRPSVLVDRSAAMFLSRAGHGHNMQSEGQGRIRTAHVVIDGCEIRWQEEAN